jgi:hypothetical protein
MKLAERTDALLVVVEDHRRQRCAALLEPARVEAQAQLRAALEDAHRRVRTALAEERSRFKTEVGAVEAALATERRLVAQHHAVRTLQTGWQLLRESLVERWRDAGQRERWVAAHLQRAAAALAGRGDTWQVAFEPGWTAAEREAARRRLELRGVTLQCEPNAALIAGIVISCGHNVLDASLDGLLADRPAIEGRLLQLMQERP